MNEEDDNYLLKAQLSKVARAEEEKMAFLLGDCFDRLEQAYRIMNWFASGESQNQYSRVLPTDILGEVYFILAPVFDHMKVLNNPKASAKAKNWYEKSLEEEREKMDQKIKDAEYLARHRVEREQQVCLKMVEKVEDRARKEVQKTKDEMDARVREAVKKAVKRTEDRLKGKQRVVPGSGRTVRL